MGLDVVGLDVVGLAVVGLDIDGWIYFIYRHVLILVVWKMLFIAKML